MTRRSGGAARSRAGRTVVVVAAPVIVASGLLLAGVAAGSTEAPARQLARPPAAAGGQGVVATVDAVVAEVDTVVADVIARTASEDGALEQEGASDFVLSGDVYFDTGSSQLLPRATRDLQDVAERVREAGVDELLVVGHTDSVGSDADNQVLSEDRAAAVVAALQPRLPGVTLTAEGRGESEPVADERTEDGEDDPAGRALNRRVTIAPVD